MQGNGARMLLEIFAIKKGTLQPECPFIIRLIIGLIAEFFLDPHRNLKQRCQD